MMFLKNLSKIALACIVISSPVSAEIVALDLGEIYEKYSLVSEANSKIDEAEGRFKRIVSTANLELKELEKKGKKAEIDKKKVEIQEVVDEEVEKLHDTKELYNTSINRNIAKTLAALAKAKDYELIIDRGYVISDIKDITGEFITALEKNTKPVKL